MNSPLDISHFHEVEPPATDPCVATSELAKTDLLTVALSRFGDWRPEAQRLVDKFKDVVFDVATAKGMAEALAARQEVRKPRFAAQNVSKASKSELAKVSKAVGAEEAEIIKALAATEEHIDAQIRAEVERKARLKAEADAAEAARKQVHTDNIAKLEGYVARATGKTATQLATAIAFVECVDTSGYEEYTVDAEAAKQRTLDALRRMHRLALDEEQAQQQREAQREADARLAAERAAFEAEKAAWLASQQPPAPDPEPEPEPESEPEPELEQQQFEPAPKPEPAQAAPAAPASAPPPAELTAVLPKPLRKAMNATEPRSVAELTPAELRNEFMLFLDAVDLVVPVIAKHAATIDAQRFMAALKRLSDVMAA